MNVRTFSFITLLLLAWLPRASAQVNASATFTVTGDWGAGANVTMRLFNHGTTAIPAWPLEFDFGRTIGPYNNAVVSSRVGAHYVMNKESYYPANIPPGGSLYFDMLVTPGAVGADAPINVKLAGVAIGASTLSISDASIAEGAAGTTALNFTVTLSAAPAAGQTVTVNYATTSGTAVSGADFVAGSGTVTFAAGETVKGIAVLVNGDAVEESDETLVVTLSGATGTAISDASGTGTIVNDDFIFHVRIADAGVFEGDSGTTILGVTVSISPAATGAVSVDVQSQAGTAAAGQDFTAVSQTITFAVGETTKTVSVPIVGDTVAEAAEAFTLNLSNPSAANVIIADALANVIIYDNDGGGSSVLIGELCSAPSSRKLRWLADGAPRLGMGVPWMNAGYADAWWQSGALPAGFGYAGLGTDVAAQMSGRTPSLYLRREFTVSAADAASGAALKLQVEFDDGFIAYVNGVEVARANMGPAKQFIFASQEAFNARPSTSVQEFDLGAASARLVAGTDVIAIHAANAVTDPAANNFAATPTFRINAGLLVTGGSTLVGYGAAGGAWRMFVGLAEPSGGVFDPVLLTGSFTPPAGQEEDFEDVEKFADWIELNNYGTAPVDLGGWGLSDNASAPMKWRIPAGTMVPAGGHLLVLCDGREESNGFSALTPRTLIAPGASWKYYDQVSAPLPDWNALAFDDATWSAGPAPLGYSPTNQDGAATVIAGGTNTQLTNYFRRHFTVANPATFSGVMTLRFQRDDGIVIWLNGAFLASDNITTPTTHTTPADSNVTDEAAWITRTVALTGLVAGDNVIAVEVHQNSGASTDTRFDLDLSAYEQVPGSATTMLHASFKLDGEALTLSSPSGALMDTIATPPRQSSFHSWGRSGANPTTFGFLDATPGTPNAATAIANRAESPEFLKADLTPLPSGFYMGAQSLVLRSATPGATIRYTTDGSDPTDTTGTAYSGPIALTAPNDKTAVIIRARTFAAGMLPSKDIAGTYLMNQHSGLRAMPVLSLVQDAGRAFFLPGGVMAISGGSYDGDTLWQPGTIASYNVPQHHGPTTEREISVELIHPDGTPGFRDDVGLRMSGSAYGRPRYKFQQTANSPWTIYEPKEKGSFNLMWRDDFGAKDLDHEIFPGWDTRTFRQLRLRAGSNDNFNPFISDEYMRRLLGEMGHDHIRGMFAMLYVNGSFKGMYNVCERLRNETFQNHFRTENDFDVKYVNEYPAGDNVAYTTFRATYDKDLSVAANFDAVRAAADLENVADYYALNIYANTWDWATWQAGANNYVLYRERVAAAKWRFTVWDGEGTFNNQSYFSQPPSFNVIANHLTGADDTNELATIWKRLVGVAPFTGANTKGNVEFRLLVADRINKHLWNGGVLDDRAAAGRFVGLKNELKAMVKTGVDYLDNAWREDWFTTWTNTSTGRRAYLFGGQATQLRDAGVWPLTEPPVFSQHGGVVAANYALAMTSNVATAGQTAQILYTPMAATRAWKAARLRRVRRRTRAR